ncbi:hypothetical protein JHK86_041908 [Glycine max]|nr:hypothetical protein JHK86_041908 [Glycine max]
MERITKLASQKAVVIFSKSSCGMSHAIKRLFYEQGVGPAIYELDEDTRGKEMEWALLRLGCNPSVPAVFVGGKFVGSANTVMTLHLNGSLKKMLRDAAGKRVAMVLGLVKVLFGVSVLYIESFISISSPMAAG